MRVIGLDPSLTATGIAIIDSRTAAVDVRTIASKGKAGATLESRAGRLHDIVANLLCNYMPAEPVDLVVIEQPAFSRTTGHHHDRSGLWWLMVDALGYWQEEPLSIVEVTPGTLKKYAAGRGNAGKDEVLLAVARRYPNIPIKDNNQADALVLAAMGARALGYPIDQLPKLNLTAMDAVKWADQ